MADLYWYYDSANATLHFANSQKNTSYQLWNQTSYLNYTEAINLINDDVPLILPTSCRQMFYNLKKITSLDLSDWDVSNVENMDSVFRGCTLLQLVEFSNWDVSKVKTMNGLFYQCVGLTTFDASKWITSSLTNTYGMFLGCTSLSNVDLFNWDTSKVTNFGWMFSDCTKLETVNIFNARIDAAISLQQMFSGCAKLQYIYTRPNTNWTFTTASSISMFKNCRSLPNYDSTKLDASKAYNNNDELGYFTYGGVKLYYEKRDGGIVYFYNEYKNKYIEFMPGIDGSCKDYSDSKYFYAQVCFPEDVSYMFLNCNNAEMIDVGLSNTSICIDMKGMFSNSTPRNLSVGDWDTSNVSNMGIMFSDIPTLSYIPLDNWNTSNVVNMSGMFSHCTSLYHIDVSRWNISNVTNISMIFDGCTTLKEINADNWNTSNVINFSAAFQNCSSLTDIKVSKWNTFKSTWIMSMFSGCSSLETLDLSEWHISINSMTTNMFYNCDNLKHIYTSSNTDWRPNILSGAGMFDGCNKLHNFNPMETDAIRAYSDDIDSMGYFETLHVATSIYVNKSNYWNQALTSLKMSNWKDASIYVYKNHKWN